MKNIKFIAVIAAFVTMFSLSSCLGDSENTSYNFTTYVTLKQSAGGEYYFITDDNLILKPTTTSVLAAIKLTDGTYLKRYIAAVRLQEGETFQTGKSTYNITAADVYNQIPYKSFTTQSDTIKNNYGIADIKQTIWASNGYLNIPVYYYGSSKLSFNDFNVYATGADKDTLFVTLAQSCDTGSTGTAYEQLMSFSMPFSDISFARYYSQAVPKNDSIVFKLTAKTIGDKNVVKTTKYKYTQR